MAEILENSGSNLLKIIEALSFVKVASQKPYEIWQKWQEILSRELGVSKIVLFIFNEDKNLLSLQKGLEIMGKKTGEAGELEISPKENSKISEVFNTQKIILDNKVESSDPLSRLLEKEASLSFMGIPLKGQNKNLGVMLFLSKDGFSESQKIILPLVAYYLSAEAFSLIILGAEKFQLEELNQQKALLKTFEGELQKKQAALAAAKQVIEKDAQEMQRLMALKSDFISAVSHELRTPLTSIKESISLIQEGATGPLTENMKKFLAIARNNIDRLSRLINDMLDFSKIEAGKLKLNKKVTRLEPLITDVAKTLAINMAKKNIDFKVNFSEPIPSLYLDPDRIIQVILNLVNNALKFTPENGKTTVEVKLVTDFPGFSEIKDLYPVGQKFVEVIVSDSGCGIKEEDLPKLFQKFQQLESGLGRHYRGIGLGLVISKELIEIHGGKIWVESKHQEGSKFQFVIPLKEPPKILVVDDEPSVVEAVSLILETKDYQVLKAYDGNEALESVSQVIPDLIILDIRMPKMDGYEVVKHLKRNEVFRRIPILILSGYTVDTGLLKSFGLSRIYSLAKPFNAEELLNEAEQLVKGE